MKALVYHGPAARVWEDVPDAAIAAPTDIVMRVDAVTICGTDLHILKGDVPEVEPGTILGHEAVGTVVETGSAVSTLREGDRILASCITSCGHCPSCREGRYGLCTGGGGWILGHLIDGVQAEFARIPFADTSRTGSRRISPTSRSCSSRTSCPRRTRSACSPADSAPVTPSRSSVPARSASRPF